MKPRKFVKENARGVGFGRVVYETVEDRAKEILQAIVAPVCEFEGEEAEDVWADFYSADISCFTCAIDKELSRKQKDEIMQKIAEKYKFENSAYWNFLDKEPLSVLALYSLSHENTKKTKES